MTSSVKNCTSDAVRATGGDWGTWRMARFLARDSDRRSRCSLSRDMSSLWYSACSVFFCGGHKQQRAVSNFALASSGLTTQPRRKD